MMPKQFLLPGLFSVTPFRSAIKPRSLQKLLHRLLTSKCSRRPSVQFGTLAAVNSCLPMCFSVRLSFHMHSTPHLSIPISVYPIGYASLAQLRTAFNFVRSILLFILDEISYDQDGRGASRTGDLFLWEILPLNLIVMIL
jgi:hypothetical protein